MRIPNDIEIISTYTQKEAIADGLLAKLCDIRWCGVTRPYVGTTNVLAHIGYDGAMEIWKEFVDWRIHVMPNLPEEERLFYTGVDGRKVWIIEDDAGYTIMYPEDY